MTQPAATRSEQLLLFGRNFLKHPRMLGSVIPSSRFLVRRLLEPVDWSRAGTVVEYGPGVGTFTAEILRRLRADARLVAIETNAEFVRFLRRTIRDDRLHVVHGSAADSRPILSGLGFARADYVISGLPYATMPAETRERILRATHEVLDPTGAFLLFQYSRMMLSSLQRVFARVHQGYEPRNLMPARIFCCHPHPEPRPAARQHESRLRSRATR